MNWQEFPALFVLATAMSFTPGPNTTLSTALAANHSLRRTLGFGALVLAVPLLSWAVKIIGVGYLLWLASKITRSRQFSEADAERLNATFWQGAALQFVNIKAWMLFI